MSQLNNCEPCVTTTPAPLEQPPVCSTPACEEYTSSDCVTSDISGGCNGVYYEVDANGNPTSTPINSNLGLTIAQNDTLSQILTNLVSPNNCVFNPEVLTGMLQVIQASRSGTVDPTLYQVFCNLVCSCSCDDNCTITTVDTVSFDNITTTGFDINFFAVNGYTYFLTLEDTTGPVLQTYTYLYQHVNATGIVTLPSTIFVSQLESGNNFQLTIDSISNGESCSTGPWFIQTLPDVSCNCDATLEIIPIVGNTNELTFDIKWVTGTTYPLQYLIEVYFAGSPVGVPVYINAATPGGNNVITNVIMSVAQSGDYDVIVTAVCSLDPYCVSVSAGPTVVPVTGAAFCAPPDITNVTVS